MRIINKYFKKETLNMNFKNVIVFFLVFLILGAIPVIAIGSGDQDDDTADKATEISLVDTSGVDVLGESPLRMLNAKEDVDWFKFSTKSGYTYIIETMGECSPPFVKIDTIVTYYRADAITSIRERDDYGWSTRCSKLYYPTPVDAAAGLRYVKVRSYDVASFTPGAYSLNITPVSPYNTFRGKTTFTVFGYDGGSRTFTDLEIGAGGSSIVNFPDDKTQKFKLKIVNVVKDLGHYNNLIIQIKDSSDDLVDMITVRGDAGLTRAYSHITGLDIIVQSLTDQTPTPTIDLSIADSDVTFGVATPANLHLHTFR